VEYVLEAARIRGGFAMETLKTHKGEVKNIDELLAMLEDKNDFEKSQKLLKSEKVETFLTGIGEEECALFAVIIRSFPSPDILLLGKFARSNDIVFRSFLIDQQRAKLGELYLDPVGNLIVQGHTIMKRFVLVSYITHNFKRPALTEFVKVTEQTYGQNPPGNQTLKIGGGFLKKAFYISGENFPLIRRILASSRY
jgi:hypothetical protein